MFKIRTIGSPVKIKDLIIPGVASEPLEVSDPKDIAKIKSYLAVNVHLSSQFLISEMESPKRAEPKKAAPKVAPKAAPKARKSKLLGKD